MAPRSKGWTVDELEGKIDLPFAVYFNGDLVTRFQLRSEAERFAQHEGKPPAEESVGAGG